MKLLPRRTGTTAALLALLLGLGQAEPARAADSAESIYTRALARERELRETTTTATLQQLRQTIKAYETVVRRFPRSGYCDNALWQAANLALLAFESFNEPADRRTALRLFTRLTDHYPSSPLVGQSAQAVRRLEAEATETASTPPPGSTPPAVSDLPVALVPQPTAGTMAEETREPRVSGESGPDGIATIRDIKRTALPDGIRVSIELDGESLFRRERLENPKRVFFDLKRTRAAPALQDATLRFGDDVVREIRLGRHPNSVTRIVMDMEAVDSYSVFTLYNPFRLVVDFKRAAAAPAPEPAATTGTAAALPAAAPTAPRPAAEIKTVPASKEAVPPIPRPSATGALAAAVPSANANGSFSLSRQLGLGVSRIVLDAGHGGHDPGARANSLNEAELVLDVTLRLKALLEKQPGIEVTLTRETDVFIPLEERTALANREGADLFLSIHANASRNVKARGIETYFLNFAPNPEAEAVAARENAYSTGRTMRNLPDIVRAIALNNKIDESRDFAEMVQKAMVRRLVTRNSQVRDLGVKQAPFVVLIGASMPSVLAEISFVTNRQEAALLKTGAYRQQIAESLFDAVLRYQRSLKGVRAVAARD